ncbi:VCBS domain-containing protein, partial [Anabaena sp. CCY 9910]|uniref:VCBS domain-containing protein n=1 Tax=Anabaena sp. CCY 9910 TaxID=3103870 RepID=UPI0039E1D4BF
DGTLKYYKNTGSATNPVYTVQIGTANPLNGIDVGSFSTPTLADIDGDGDLDTIVGEGDGTLKYYKNTGSATNPVYTVQTGTANPFNGINVGAYITPTFADIDGDGDKDLIVGGGYGTLNYYKNNTPPEPFTFIAATDTANPFNGIDVGSYSTPTSADIDGDGDKDLIVGGGDGTLKYYKNTGSATNPVYTEQTGTANPFNGIDVGFGSTPTLADIDGDGDLDAIVGEGEGTLKYYKNTGSATNPVYTVQTGTANPFNGIDVGFFITPTLADIDGDGDLDAIVGERDGTLKYYKNTGSATNPVYTVQIGTANPLNGIDVGSFSTPTLADIDGDGDLDTIVGEGEGTLKYYKNTGSATNPVYTVQTGTANPFNGIDVGFFITPTLADIDDDGDLDAIVGEQNGTLKYFYNIPNYPPVAVNDAVSTDEDTILNGNVLAANPTTRDTDPDGDRLTVTQVNGSAANVGTQINLGNGKLRVNANGFFTFDPTNGTASLTDGYDYLAQDATAKISFNYTISDGNNGTASATATITIIGVNDTATITSIIATGAVTEDSSTTNLTATGSLTVADVDTGENKFNTTVISDRRNIGSLTIIETGSWTYTVANSAVQSLGAGQTKTETFTVQSVDGTASQNVVVTITGVNDTATITGATTGAVTEDGSVTNLIGTNGFLTVNDVDTGENKFNTTVTSASGNLGSFTISESGRWNYIVANSAMQFLGAGVTKTETFTVKSFDGTASQDIVVTITGVNDAATITGTATASVTEDASTPNLTTTGALIIDDVDTGENKFNTTVTGTNNLGSLTIAETGTWNYTVANSAVQFLGAGATKTETFTVQSIDGTASQDVVVTINGVNDAPTLANAIADQTATANQSFNFVIPVDTFADVDAGDTLTYSATLDNDAALPSWLQFNPNTRTFSGTPTINDVGIFNIKITASDSQGATVTDIVTLTVKGSNIINGDDNDNFLSGTPNADIINGFGGNDYIEGLGGNDTIDAGNGRFDRIFGGDGDDVIIDPDGILGAHGGTGNDTINITFAANWDNDTNPGTAPRSDGKITGGYGSDIITVTMNSSQFFINLKGDEPVSNTAQDGDDVVTLLGSYQNAIVDLNGGNDTFIGGIGSDNVSGGAGNDTISGFGGNDKLTGNDGDDILVGGAGNDNLTGGNGKDIFDFSSPLSDGIDTITDFSVTDDKIRVDAAGFGGGLVAGVLLPTQFVLGTVAQNENSRFIYNQSTGALFFDVDGTGSSRQVQIATLSNRAVIDSTNIVLV